MGVYVMGAMPMRVMCGGGFMLPCAPAISDTRWMSQSRSQTSGETAIGMVYMRGCSRRTAGDRGESGRGREGGGGGRQRPCRFSHLCLFQAAHAGVQGGELSPAGPALFQEAKASKEIASLFNHPQ
ncbi:hypothetical protein ABL78_8246 [Leptomonas seymouri]|uniref:Uncharacterized protein n=1 Tax=Leptomonas seymouri TaxID=5684 RepID=A0A0N1IH87_LEPSE|nr:hypothetical protein ABL78_8246 [Leptomonas seymouri]|eukprot:KPI82742.1 hypothetical protein ABL78_8246 [Leptomonas seymouri]